MIQWCLLSCLGHFKALADSSDRKESSLKEDPIDQGICHVLPSSFQPENEELEKCLHF